MPDSTPYKSPSQSFVKAESRDEAVKKMIRRDPLLRALYKEGDNKDGKAGWVNAIRDQRDAAYRLLFYVDRLPLAPEFGNLEPYEVLYGEVNEHDEVNYPRALFTTTGAINLMRDGIPGERFVNGVLKGILQIVPYELGRDIQAKHLREDGYAYICIYDRDGQGIRVLDLLEYSMIYDNRSTEEIQVHTLDDLVIGDTKFVRPFLLKYAATQTNTVVDAAKSADAMLRRMR